MKKNYQMALLNFRSLVAAVVFGIMIFLTSCAKEESIGTLTSNNGIKSSNLNVLRAALDETGRKNLQIKMFIEGFYSGHGEMKKATDENGVAVGLLNSAFIKANNSEMWLRDPKAVDYVTVTLYSNATGRLIQEGLPHTGILYVNGLLNLSFDAPDGDYFLKVNHRNTIETWSSLAVTIKDGENSRYDFTTSMKSAYGSNMINLGDDHNPAFAFFSGDISDAATARVGSQDGLIESQDYSDMENAVITYLEGYVTEDITGDGIVESEDYSLMENNLSFSRQAAIPPDVSTARMRNPAIAGNFSTFSPIINAHK